MANYSDEGGNSSGPFLGVSGAVTAPTYSFASASTSGIYWTGSALGFAISGALEMSLTGTSLDVSGTSSGLQLRSDVALRAPASGVTQFHDPSFAVAQKARLPNTAVADFLDVGFIASNVCGLDSTNSGGTSRRLSLRVGGTERFGADTTGLSFFATTPAAQQTVTGSRAANAALTSLLTALATYGLIVDSTS